MIRSAFAVAAASIAASLSFTQPLFAQEETDQRLGHGALRHVMQDARSGVRSGHALPAFVLVSRISKNLRGCAEGRSRMRHRLLGHCPEPACLIRTSRRRPESRRRALPRSERERASALKPSASATISTPLQSCTLITKKSIIAPACRPIRRPWRNWRSAIRTTTKLRSITRCRSTSASAADKTYANQLKGAAILEPIFERQPQHPGVAHYLIHLYDYPPIAEKGSMPRGSTPRSLPTPPTHNICPRISSRASAIGRNR